MAPDPSTDHAATPKDQPSCAARTPPKVSPDEMRAVARKFADQPVQDTGPGVWALLTAISKKARLRPQGINILLNADEHCLGRTVEERFQVSALSISGKHCKIYRDTVLGELNRDEPVPVYLKDTSSNGTYLNWRKLKKNSPPAKLNHGDIVSFTTPPHDDTSYAFVYREANAVTCLENGATILKRKSAREGCSGSKRLKGLGIGSPDGPVSLDDVRRLEKSNSDLREQLEAHVVTIETLRTERKKADVQHEKELEELRETTSSSFLDRTRSLQLALEEKQSQLDSLVTSNTELQNSVKDLDEMLSASRQSRFDADEIISSQKSVIGELEVQLSEERNLRREDRDKAAEDLKSALHKMQAESQEEIKRQADSYLRQQREQKEVISKLQESEKESRLIVETLRSKLEDARENLVISEKKVRELDAQLQDEQQVSASYRKKSENLESELKKMKKELENEKAAREEAWAKVSALELEIAGTIRDLSIERQRYQGARERIILRETQLRSFYSTTEEISALFAKQQEQLKAMQRTLEDEENYESTLISVDLNKVPLETVATVNNCVKPGECSKTMEASGASAENTQVSEHSSTDQDVDMAEQQDGGTAEGGGTQGFEGTSPERSEERFRSDLHGDPVATALEREVTETEQVPETESQAGNVGCDDQDSNLQRCDNMGGETMPLEDEVQPQETEEPGPMLQDGEQPLGSDKHVPIPKDDTGHCSEETHEDHYSESKQQDTRVGTIGTADLLTSEVPGSWAIETAPSVNGENDSPRSLGDMAAGPDAGLEKGGSIASDALHTLANSDDQGAGSQNNVEHVVSKTKEQHRVLSMIEIVDPEFRKQISRSSAENNDQFSDAETEEGREDDDTDDDSGEALVEDSVG